MGTLYALTERILRVHHNRNISADLRGTRPGCLKQPAAKAVSGSTRIHSCEVYWRYIPVLNDEIIAEYEDVLNRPKFRFDKKAVRLLLALSMFYGIAVRMQSEKVEDATNLGRVELHPEAESPEHPGGFLLSGWWGSSDGRFGYEI